VESIFPAFGRANAYPEILDPSPMEDSQMNRWLLIISLALALVGIRVPAAIDQQSDTDNARVKLVKQRHAVLEKRLDVLQEQYLIGGCTLLALMDAREDYLLSALELAKTREERIKILLDRFENLRNFEKQIAQRFANGTTNVADLHLATANRLAAEIDLLDARSENLSD
jgi:outer membrane protein TolC